MSTPTSMPTPVDAARRWRRRFIWLAIITLGPVILISLYAAIRFLPDRPVVYSDPADHFKYGSTGGERESGFPYWIWKVLPQVCSKHLPGPGLESIGMIFEKGKDLPVGMSKRHNLGIDRVFVNCAVCHASTVRTSVDAKPELYLGMPAQQLDLLGFENFLFNCAVDEHFSVDYIVPAIEKQAGGLSLVDRKLVYPIAISIMRDRLLMLKKRFAFTEKQTAWGPGRVDTFNAAKVLFSFPMDQLPAAEMRGMSDFPSIWLQSQRKLRDDGQPMQLHWDGNNTAVEERNRSAAFGTGTTPPTIDMQAIGRIETWLSSVEPPKYPLPIDAALTARGKPIYEEYCAACHGQSGRDFRGAQVGHVTSYKDVATDRGRMDSYTYDLAVNQATLYAGYGESFDAPSHKPRFQRFSKTFGYANMPLDGIWLRGPYLHNGSVPTLRDLLEPEKTRPTTFWRGNDLIDSVRVGFVSNVEVLNGRKLYLYDTHLPSNSNAGHSGKIYGTELTAQEKDALVEYLKTF
jgi:mono/diheme cytochrome c family protein